MKSNLRNHNVSVIDVNHMMYGNFIGVIYVFEQSLDKGLLSQAWEHLQTQCPWLAARYDGLHQSLRKEAFSSLQYAESGLFEADVRQQPRSNFILEPDRRSVLSGKSPLSSLQLTKLADGKSVLGLALNHVITDAGGFHKIAHHLGHIYSVLADGKPVPEPSFVTNLPEFSFGTNHNWAETKTELAGQGLKTPFSIRGAKGWLPRNMIVWAMNKISTQKRLRVHLTPEQVRRLKASALEESGEDWISTNAALCAHFTAIMINLIHDGTPKKSLRIGQLLDLRNRYFEDPDNLQSGFIGNAILIHTEQATLENYARGALTRFFKSMVDDLSPEFIKSRLDVIADCLRHGRNYPGLEMSDPLLAVNNQTKMPAYNIDINGFKPADIIPQDVGDNIMFFPAPDSGVDVYIRDILNPKRQAKLETREWQERIFDF